MTAPPVKYVRTRDGYRIAYTVEGEGVPLVRMPMGSAQIEQRLLLRPRLLMEQFAASFKVVCYDARGTGLSQRGLSPACVWRDLQLDLEAVVDELQLSTFVLSSELTCGAVAVSYALDHPDRVAALVLRDPLIPDMPEASISKRNWSALLDLAKNDWDYFLESVARASFSGEDPREVKKLLFAWGSQSDYLIQASSWFSCRIGARLNEVRAPALVLAHRSNVFASVDMAKGVAAIIPNATLAFLEEPGASPMPPIQEFVAGLGLEDLLRARGALPRAAVAAGLSLREVEVLRLLASGMSNQEIADELVISLNTVRRHVSNIFAKANLRNRAEAGVYAQRLNLI